MGGGEIEDPIVVEGIESNGAQEGERTKSRLVEMLGPICSTCGSLETVKKKKRRRDGLHSLSSTENPVVQVRAKKQGRRERNESQCEGEQ